MQKRTALLSATATILVFSAGWAFGNSEIADRVKSGLVVAINSVGQNLFGSAIFGATIINPEILPNPDGIPTVQLDFGDTSEVPVLINLFHPPDPVEPSCEAYAQLSIYDGVAMFIYDSSLMRGDELMIIDGALVGHPPDPCRGDVVVLPPPG
jgi:hypothetical protein